MKKRLLKKIKNEILSCKRELRELAPHIYSNASVAVAYNRALVKKAILVDKLKKLNNPFPILDKIGGMFKFKKREKLICDFFPPA